MPSFRLLFRMLVLLLLTLAGCSEGESNSEKLPQEESNVLHFYNWEEYVLPELLQEFEEREGIKVILHSYLDEDDILAALQSGLTNADLVVVSDNIVEELYRGRLLHPLNRERIPNLRFVAPHPFYYRLPGDVLVTVPYLMGTVGVLVNRNHVPDSADSWQVLWDHQYSGRMAMLDNSLDVLDAGCNVLGYSINTESPRELEHVREKLMAQRSLLTGYFDTVTLMGQMVEGRLYATQMYNGDAVVAMQDNPDLRFFIPREGTSVWVDCLVVPLRAAHAEAAMRFINFLHEPEVMARNAAYLGYQPVNTAAIELMPLELKNSPILFPPRSVMQRCESFQPIKAEAMHQRLSIWAQLRSSD